MGMAVAVKAKIVKVNAATATAEMAVLASVVGDPVEVEAGAAKATAAEGKSVKAVGICASHQCIGSIVQAAAAAWVKAKVAAAKSVVVILGYFAGSVKVEAGSNGYDCGAGLVMLVLVSAVLVLAGVETLLPAVTASS